MQVFSNVISNAIDSMSVGGLLSIQIGSMPGISEEGLHVVIQDEGVGIAAQNVQKVFEPFFSTKGNLGTGIGLWVAKQLAEKQGGKITLTSSTSAEGHGTRVVISLPFTESLLSTEDAVETIRPAIDNVHRTEIIRLPDLPLPNGHI